jgi:tRNA(Phe) wybutosine-synthesizing methylase Tyw3
MYAMQVTSSSCSGRIAVFCGVPATATAGEAGAEGGRDESVNLITKGGKWLLAEHATITWEQLSQALRSPDAISANSNMVRSFLSFLSSVNDLLKPFIVRGC